MYKQFHLHRSSLAFWLLWLGLAFWGFWASIDIGVGWDEEAERATLLINLSAIQGLLQGNPQGYEALLAHGDRYYGIGFHLPAYALTHAMQSLFDLFSISIGNVNLLVLPHTIVWFCYLGMTLMVRFLLNKLLMNISMANIGTLTFALWPYLLGHGLMNIKDLPFAFAWLLCTIIALPLVQLLTTQTRPLPAAIILRIQLLALATAWLLSIRIAGILIFLQYCAMVLSCWYFVGLHLQPPSYTTARFLPFTHLLRYMVLPFALFLPTFTICLIALYPVAWHNPLELLHAISYMSHHPWDGTTLTAGRFIAPGNSLSLYIGVWLLAKLPLIVIIGLILIPVTFYRRSKHSNDLTTSRREELALWLGLTGGAVLIISILIGMGVGLYNELRQALFLFPLLFIVSFTSLYYLNSKITLVGALLSCGLFFLDNTKLYPYLYSYLNEVARQRPAVQYFETDYFGFSAGRSARWLSSHPEYSSANCVYAYPLHLLSYELNPSLYPCLQSSNGHGRNLPPNYSNLLYITQRNLINFAIPANCFLIHSEERTLPFSSNPLIMGRLFECSPLQ